MPKERQYYNNRRNWRIVYRVTRGPLKGRTYKTEGGYRRALDRIRGTDLEREERFQGFFQEMILQKGGRYASKNKDRLRNLYRKAKKNGWEKCPPANGATEDEAPFAYLLDLIGVRPIEEFGWLCIGDTPEA